MALLLRSSVIDQSNALILDNAFFRDEITVVPDITLVGSAVTVNNGDTFTDPGYKATDDNDGDITNSVVVTGSVDTNTAGTYTLRYNVINSQNNAATEVIRLVTVTDFWEYTPPQNRILDINVRNIHQDGNAKSTYWLDMSDDIGDQAIVSFEIDPDGVLGDLGYTCVGYNTVVKTDNGGVSYPVGSLMGICVSGGTLFKKYAFTIRYTITGGDINDRTVNIHLVNK
jgi:hypothetical protein